MKKLLLVIMLFGYLQAIDLGSIATASKTGTYYKLGKDISTILSEYNIKLTAINTEGSFENLSILDGHDVKHKKTFFAIVQKDALSYYNYTLRGSGEKRIYEKLPVILSLGTEQIHIFTSKNNNFNLEMKNNFKVYCGDSEGGSCISAQYIEKAYGYKFTYIKSNKLTAKEKVKNGSIDLYISVTQAPASKFEIIKDLKLLKLPKNSIMDTMYTKKTIDYNTYNWIEDDIEIYSVPKVLITSLYQEKYDVVIDSIVKVILLNKDKLEENYPIRWSNMNFKYMHYKNFSKISKKLIDKTFY